MWRPDFEFRQVHKGRLSGHHRRLSLFSNHYRGTIETPGLVLGLDRGGSCVGLVYEVAEEKWLDVLEQVRKRELISDAYSEIVKTVYVADLDTTVTAVTYAVNRWQHQYAAPMDIAKTLAFVAQGHGNAGSCRDYVINTITHLRGLGIHDAKLEELAPHLGLSGGVNP
jgi:glutathione-specific gamma-glutamylcyclotransferase